MAAELSQRDHELIEQLLDDYVRWAPDEAHRPTYAGTLTGGQSHRTVLLRGHERRWVLRLARHPLPRDACHRRESVVHTMAAQAGIAPPVLRADPDLGLLLCPFVEALEGRETLAELAVLLQRIHRLTPKGPTLQIAQRLRDQLATPADEKLALLLSGHQRRLAQTADRLQANSRPSRLCHNDLLRANRRLTATGLIALDWEYACAGDPFFDLAVTASELEPMQATELLTRYLDRPPSEQEWQHFADHRLAYAVIAAAWYARYLPAALTEALGVLQQALEN